MDGWVSLSEGDGLGRSERDTSVRRIDVMPPLAVATTATSWKRSFQGSASKDGRRREGTQLCAKRKVYARAGGPDDSLSNLDKITGGESKEEAKSSDSGAIYASDDDSEGFFIRKEMTREQRSKLRKEYIGLGGSEGSPMASNYFLNIIIFVTILVLLSYFTGAI